MFPCHCLTLILTLGAPPDDSELQKRAEQLVSQLGDRDYRERERATKELLEIGYAARNAVQAGQKNPDGEISERCRKLYPAILRHDLERRIAKFLDNSDGPIPEDLPGASRWIEVAGDGKESRELYAQMVKAHSEPLLNAQLHPERARELYVELMRNVYSRMHLRTARNVPLSSVTGPTESEVLLFFFLGSAGDKRTASRGVSSAYYSQFLSVSFTTKMLSADPPATPFRKLFAAWLEKERYSIAMRRGLDTAARYRVKECAPVALKIAKESGTSATYRASALITFGKLASKENLKDLQSFLNDKLHIANVSVNGQRGTVEMRDVALGAAIHLTDQSLSDYGFQHRPPTALAITSYIYYYYSFSDDKKRDAAHAKWKEWVKDKLKK